MFIVQSENVAASINGEAPNGEQMQLGDDVLIFAKLIVFEQPVLNRLRANKEEGTLLHELEKCQGLIYLGDLQDIRKELHHSVDKMCDAIIAYRKKQNEKQTETR